MPAFPKPIHLAHQLIRNLVKPSDNVVDATLGNGHDALFLAGLVGEKGCVIGFDIQPSAIECSTQRMIENGMDHYDFHLTGHENMEQVITAKNLPLSVIMFNLGYLPNADKAIITIEQTTISALTSALQLLRVGGLISIMCYPGHEGGDTESVAVCAWAENLPRERCRVARYTLHNAANNPPFLLLVERMS
ncbi:MAG: class I SAM-dependent methyltransferase [Rubritalea sp.]|jgi:methylase of polypeptide subunit release factors|tara:strand:- start:140 stop:712 length:573 start_codon:yes stop_codon:yes gene_type:complete